MVTNRRLLILLAALLWAAVIFATSCTWIDRDSFVGWVWRFLPSADAKSRFAAFWDGGGGLVVVKGYHMAEYALLFLLVRAVLARIGLPGRRAAWIAALLAIGYAATDEYHQTFVPGRGGTVSDVVIDAAGVSVACLVLRLRARRRAYSDQDCSSTTLPSGSVT